MHHYVLLSLHIQHSPPCHSILYEKIELANKLDKEKKLRHGDKVRHRLAIATEVAKRKSLDIQVHDLNVWIDELADDLSAAKRIARDAAAGKERAEKLASKRLLFLKDLKAQLGACRDSLANESRRRETLE